jgi:LacI family transcriptional regulator
MKRKITPNCKRIRRISTVSKSLRNSLEIGEETRLKVQAFAKFYNYKPNNIALSLKNRKLKLLESLSLKLCTTFSTVINGIEQSQ